MSHKYKDYRPPWIEEKPPERSFRSIFKWGDPAAYKHPNERLFKLMKKTFDMTDEDFRKPVEIGYDPVETDIPIKMKPEQVEKFKQIVGEENVSQDLYHRLGVSYGKTMIDSMRLRKGIVENVADLVLYPRSKADIVAIINYCNQEKIPIYVFGGGSTVTRGMEAVKGGISLDMRRHMNKVVAFNEVDQTITVQAGMQGPDYERILNEATENELKAKRRYTCGHFPQSFEYSSVGGWVVTRGAGQNSTYYGKIEDMVICQEYVTPAGVIQTPYYPAMATGPDLDEIMMGSEGTFGILTNVTLRVFRYQPENRKKFSFIFKNWDDAMAAAREIMQAEIGYPSVFRLSDPEETDVAMKLYGVEGTVIEKILNMRGYKPMERCLFLGWTEGEKSFAANMKRKIKKICRKYSAMYTTGYITSSWEKGRFRDPYMREDLQDFGIMIDTLECAVTWSQMKQVHEGVRAYCKSRPQTICMTHMSHCYPQGANLYFIFIAKMSEIDDYLEYQTGILDNIQKYGAAMSHHHGIGKMTAPWLEHQIGKNQYDVFRVLKNHFDPNMIMNPGGTLGFDLEEEQKRNKRKRGPLS
jgi:alkyldihydroxyacetonephosphate synthase